MNLNELDFNLPEELIAQEPARPADAARLMVLDRTRDELQPSTFTQIADFLQPGDVLVFNNSKVLPARLIGAKPTGGKVEILLLKAVNTDHWQALVRGGHKLVSTQIFFDNDLSCFVETQDNDTFTLHFNQSGEDLMRTIMQIGHIPTPPYIKRMVPNDEYQNIFADPTKVGSAAAPTAGLHFTPRVFDALQKQGIQVEYVTLHVGLGTFQPITTERVEDHPIHSEYYEVSRATLERLHAAQRDGRRIIAVGTTSCRVLESVADHIAQPTRDVAGETSIFIYPGYTFRVINGLVTNFHTPRSSLLALVMALAGQQRITDAYTYAIEHEWKFFSLGDGMLII